VCYDKIAEMAAYRVAHGTILFLCYCMISAGALLCNTWPRRPYFWMKSCIKISLQHWMIYHL